MKGERPAPAPRPPRVSSGSARPAPPAARHRGRSQWARGAATGGGVIEGRGRAVTNGLRGCSRRRSRRGPSPAGRSGSGLAGRESFAPGWEMPRGLRVLAGNAARGNGSPASAPSAGGTGPGGEGRTGRAPLRRSRRRQDKRGAASGAGPPPNSRRGSPALQPRSLPRSRRCLPVRAPFPGQPAGCPAPLQVCGAPGFGHPRGAGAARREAPCPPRGAARAVPRVLFGRLGLAFPWRGRRAGAVPPRCPGQRRSGKRRCLRVPAPPRPCGHRAARPRSPHGPASRGTGLAAAVRRINRASVMGETFRAKIILSG